MSIHRCGFGNWCQVCLSYREPGPLHNCYIVIPDEKKKQKIRENQQKLKLIVYDIETQGNTENEDGSWKFLDKHIAVCVVARKVYFKFYLVLFIFLRDVSSVLTRESTMIVQYVDRGKRCSRMIQANPPAAAAAAARLRPFFRIFWTGYCSRHTMNRPF